MRKIITFLISLTLLILSVYNVNSQTIIGTAVISDNTVFIDYQPIPAYKVDGYNYIFTEGLDSYGFDVVWNQVRRSLFITRNKNKKIDKIPAENINRLKSDVQKEYSIYATNIEVYLDDKKLDTYNLDGQTIIKIRDLADCAYIYWNDKEILSRGDVSTRLFDMNEQVIISLKVFDMYERYNQNIENMKVIGGKNFDEVGYEKDQPTIYTMGNSFHSSPFIRKVEYHGETLSDNIRNGLGKELISISNQGYPLTNFQLGIWANNKLNGEVIQNYVDGYNKTGNKSQSIYLGNYKDGLCYGSGITAQYYVEHGGQIKYPYTIMIGEYKDSIHTNSAYPGRIWVDHILDGQGRIIQEDSNYIYGCKVLYDGEWGNNKPTGNGTIYDEEWYHKESQ